jgi:hypothetical protein
MESTRRDDLTEGRLGVGRPMKTNGAPARRKMIGRVAIGLLIFAILGINLAAGQAPTTVPVKSDAGSQQTPLMDRQKEIALALSACPSSVASKAAVYVLQESGYVKVREGHNGFTAIVQHLLPSSQEPLCMNAEATRAHLPPVLKIAELRAQGESPEEIKRFVDDAFAKGVFQPPSRPSLCYMLSTENLVPTDKGVVQPFPPHVMFYAPYLTNAELGSDGDPAGPVFVAREGTRDATIIVPVAAHALTDPSHASAEKRSDGSQ